LEVDGRHVPQCLVAGEWRRQCCWASWWKNFDNRPA